MATVRRGWSVRCPACNEEDTLRVDLADVAVLTCTGCDETFDRETVLDIIEQHRATWTKLLKWLDSAPSREDD